MIRVYLEVGHQVVEEVLTTIRCPLTKLTTAQRRSKTKVHCRSSRTVHGTKRSLLKNALVSRVRMTTAHLHAHCLGLLGSANDIRSASDRDRYNIQHSLDACRWLKGAFAARFFLVNLYKLSDNHPNSPNEQATPTTCLVTISVAAENFQSDCPLQSVISAAAAKTRTWNR